MISWITDEEWIFKINYVEAIDFPYRKGIKSNHPTPIHKINFNCTNYINVENKNFNVLEENTELYF